MSWARLYPPAVTGVFVGVLAVATALGIESWPFSSYPMYSVPSSIEDVESTRFAFELEGGERVLWKPDFPYVARDLETLLERRRGRPELQSTLRTAAAAVLADLRAEGSFDDPSRIRRVVVVHRRVGRDTTGRFVPEDRTLAAFTVETLE